MVELGGDRGAPVAAGVGAGQEVLLDRQVAEAVPPFHDLDQAAPHHLGRVEPVDADAREGDRAFGDLAALGPQEV